MKNENQITWKLNGYDVKINHPGKLYFPEDGLTKENMLDYYKAISPQLLKYFKNRPVTLRIFPQGSEGFSYYRRDLAEGTPGFISSFPYKEKTKDKILHVPLIKNLAGLIWLAARGGIEYHLWASTVPEYEEPDMAIFDMDIGPKGKFSNILKTALYLREILDSENVKAYPKTSGGNGLHLYVPVKKGYTFELIRNWVKTIAQNLATAHPDLVSVGGVHGATHDEQKIIIDYRQNSISRNTAAPYTIRAYKGAPVSTPLSWDEIEQGGFVPGDFTMLNIPDRVAKMGDLFAPVLSDKQSFPV